MMEALQVIVFLGSCYLIFQGGYWIGVDQGKKELLEKIEEDRKRVVERLRD